MFRAHPLPRLGGQAAALLHFPQACRCKASHAAVAPVVRAVSHPRKRPTPAPFSKYIPEPRTVAVIGAPLADGQPLLGVDRGPKCIRQRGLRKRLEKDKWRVEDFGDLDFNKLKQLAHDEEAVHGTAKRSEVVGTANKMVFDAVYKQATQEKLPLTLGGDHSIAIGSLAGCLKARPDMAVVWVDAHADINTPRGSPSGHMHGMVLSFLMDLDNARKVHGLEWMTKHKVPILEPSRLVYVGLRDLDAPEKKVIRGLGIKAYTMHEVDKYGIGKVMEMALDHILDRTERPVHLSFDIDAVDPVFAPSTGTRVAGGLSYREAYFISESVGETGLVSSMDLVEVNPSLTPDGADDGTTDMAVGLISSALGNTII